MKWIIAAILALKAVNAGELADTLQDMVSYLLGINDPYNTGALLFIGAVLFVALYRASSVVFKEQTSLTVISSLAITFIALRFMPDEAKNLLSSVIVTIASIILLVWLLVTMPKERLGRHYKWFWMIILILFILFLMATGMGTDLLSSIHLWFINLETWYKAVAIIVLAVVVYLLAKKLTD